MSVKKYFAFIFIFSLFFTSVTSVAFARTLPAGFSKDQIWFSKDPFFVGDNITVNTFVYNSSAYRMSGTMTLKDSTSTIDKRTFIVEGGGSFQAIVFPWVVTPGSHNFSALIERDEFTQGTSSIASSSITLTETAKVRRFADYDKNGNGVGDSTEPPPPPPTPPQKISSSTSMSMPQNPVQAVTDQIVDSAPLPVSSVALPVISTIENVRLAQTGKAGKNLNGAIEHIAAGKGTTTAALKAANGGAVNAGWSLMKEGVTSGQVVRSPFDYFKLFIALVIHFFVSNPYVFYVVLLLLIYKIIRVLISLFT